MLRRWHRELWDTSHHAIARRPSPKMKSQDLLGLWLKTSSPLHRNRIMPQCSVCFELSRDLRLVAGRESDSDKKQGRQDQQRKPEPHPSKHRVNLLRCCQWRARRRVGSAPRRRAVEPYRQSIAPTHSRFAAAQSSASHPLTGAARHQCTVDSLDAHTQCPFSDWRTTASISPCVRSPSPMVVVEINSHNARYSLSVSRVETAGLFTTSLGTRFDFRFTITLTICPSLSRCSKISG